MKRLFFALIAFSMMGVGLLGCRAEAEIDPDTSSSIPAVR